MVARARWCGWEMRHLVGSDPGPSYNLARNWAHWGHAANGPAPGVIGVMPTMSLRVADAARQPLYLVLRQAPGAPYMWRYHGTYRRFAEDATQKHHTAAGAGRSQASSMRWPNSQLLARV